MIKKCGFEFPEKNLEGQYEEGEFLAWTNRPRQLAYSALHPKVLAVAVPRFEGTWKVYVMPVEGQNHEEEAARHWQQNGNQVSEAVARAIFPYLAQLPYAP